MSDMQSYLIQVATFQEQAAVFRERFEASNPGVDIETSESFLAEDWRECVKKAREFAAAPFKAHHAKYGYPYIDWAPRLRRGHWRKSHKLQRQENGQSNSIFEPA
jgi:hypothetical protein